MPVKRQSRVDHQASTEPKDDHDDDQADSVSYSTNNTPQHHPTNDHTRSVSRQDTSSPHTPTRPCNLGGDLTGLAFGSWRGSKNVEGWRGCRYGDVGAYVALFDGQRKGGWRERKEEAMRGLRRRRRMGSEER